MAIKLITAPTEYPVSVAEIKAHCRIDGTTEDALVEAYLATAVAYVEEYLGRSLMTQTWEAYFDAFTDALMLPRGPVQSVESVKYYDPDNYEQTADPSLYVTDLVSEPAWVVRATDYSWPATANGVNIVVVRYVAGYSTVPAPIKHAIKMLAGDFYLSREDAVIDRGVTPATMPTGVAALLANYRLF